MNKMSIKPLLMSGAVGVVLGLVLALFMGVLEVLTDFLWQTIPNSIGNPKIYPLIICGIGGVLLGFFLLKFGKIPQTLSETLEEFDANKRIDPKNQRIAKTVIGALIILVFGGAVGPEAALFVIIGSVIARLANRYQFVGDHERDLTEFGLGTALGIIFAAPLFGVSGSVEQEDWRKITDSKLKKYIFYLITMFGGFIGYTLTYSLFPDQEQVFAILRMPAEYTWQGVLLVVPTILIGILFGLAFNKLQVLAEHLNQRIKYPLPLAITGGLLLGLAGMISPYLLFSGEHGVLSFSRSAATTSVGVLIAIGVGKVILTMMCQAFNWRGGIIFPMIFASIALGLALSKVFHFSPGLILAVFTASACTVILKKPVATAFLFLLLFPLNLFIWLLLAGIVAHLIVEKFLLRKEKATNHNQKAAITNRKTRSKMSEQPK